MDGAIGGDRHGSDGVERGAERLLPLEKHLRAAGLKLQ